MQPQAHDYKRILLAVFLAALVLTGWQALVEWPRRQHMAQYNAVQAKKQAELQAQQAAAPTKETEAEEGAQLTREQRLAAAPRLRIESPRLHGSISLTGARFDDISLAGYRETLDPDSPEVVLLSPGGDEDAYFAQAGWLSPDSSTKVPDAHTLWQADKKTLAPGDTVHLHWDNGEGVTFLMLLSLDRDYMFSIAQQAKNHSAHAVSLAPCGYINRAYEYDPARLSPNKAARSAGVLHEGPLGVMTGALEQVTYKELAEKGNKTYDDASGWFGITDRYWLSALIPAEAHYKTTFSHYSKNGRERYQVDYLSPASTLKQGETADAQLRLFAGAKELKVLDYYTLGDPQHDMPPIPLFDRAIDFGMFYFLTKPLLIMLTYFYSIIGNVGLAIMLMTVVVRAFLYPMANKSYKATAQMRALQPEMTKLRERHHDDSIALNKEMLALYKREKVNPASGCLPVFIQMPVFFALYKVLYVSIEMRHAPFFAWIKDLSVADPSNIFTAFGLVNWPAPAFLHLGVLPLLMCATMVIQMRQQPKPADPTQAKVMGFMPYFFLFVFAKMPAGLVLYWTWSNIISILQQRLISARHGSKNPPVPAAKAKAA